VSDRDGFTCPVCGFTSHNRIDVRDGYCGNCHDWTRPALTADMKILLSGVVGSTAYGMARPDSDRDLLGVFAYPTRRFLSLQPPGDRYLTIQQHSPDVTWHEVRKFLLLCLDCNPTANELLWLEGYEHVGGYLAQSLVDNRQKFQARLRIKEAYYSYANQQYRRLLSRGGAPELNEKLGRHMLRILHQGTHLYQTGQLRVRVDDPERYFDFGRKMLVDPTLAQPEFDRAFQVFNEPSPLPEKADTDWVEDWLQYFRMS
jgi:predicted nucleotidyltransferase